MRGAALTSSASLVLLWACSSPLQIDHTFGSDELSILAVVEGETVSDLVLVRPGETAVSLDIQPGQLLAGWALPTDELVDPSGVGIPADIWQGVKVRRSSEAPPGGSCGRCLLPSLEPPFVRFDGDSCAPPRSKLFGAWSVNSDGLANLSPEAAEEIRQRISVDWPGDCACALSEPKETRSFDSVRPIGLEEGLSLSDVLPFQALAESPSGALALMAADGRGRSFDSMSNRVAETQATPTLLPRVAAGLSADRFAVVFKSLEVEDEWSIRLLDASLSTLAERKETLFDVFVAAPTLDGSGFILGGSAGEQEPLLYLCDAANNRVACTDLLAGASTLVQGIKAVAPTSRGAVAFAFTGTLMFADGGGHLSELSLRDSPSVVDTQGGTVAIEPGFAELGTLGDRVFLEVTDSTGRFLVLTADLSTGNIADPRIVYHADEQLESMSFGQTTETSTSIRLYARYVSGEQTALEFGADGTLLGEPTVVRLTEADGIDRPGRLLSLAPDSEIFLGDDGSAFRRPMGQASTFVRLHGRPSYEPGFTEAFASRNGEVWAFPSEASPAHGARVAPTIHQLSPGVVSPGEITTAAAYDPRADGFILAGVSGCAECGPWLRRVSVDGQVEEIPFSGSTGIGLCGSLPCRIVSIVDLEVSPSAFVVVPETKPPRAFILKDDQLTEVEIRFDDPATPEVETDAGFGDIDCSSASKVTNPYRKLRSLRAASASMGVGWIGGCGGMLLRVTVASSPPRAERFALTRPIQDFYVPDETDEFVGIRPPDIRAVKAVCPDQVVIATPSFGVPGQFGRQSGVVFELLPASGLGLSPSGLPEDGLVVRQHPGHAGSYDRAQVEALAKPIAIVGGAEELSIIHSYYSEASLGVTQLGASSIFRFRAAPLAAIGAEGGPIIVSSYSGLFFEIGASAQ